MSSPCDGSNLRREEREKDSGRERKSPSLPYARTRARGREGEKETVKRRRAGERRRDAGEREERGRERRRNFLIAMEKFPSRERREESAGDLERGREKERKRREKEGERERERFSLLSFSFFLLSISFNILFSLKRNSFLRILISKNCQKDSNKNPEKC